MTDRELLELAAKAAGLTISWDARGAYIVEDGVSGASDVWNPLTDDGDALRLAVKLCMRLTTDDYGAAARVSDNDRWWGYEAHLNNGIEAATRRAIVRVAAEIGRTK